MPAVVVAAVRQIDSADESHVSLVAGAVADHHQLLVMGASAADTLIEDQLPTRRLHAAPEAAVLPPEEAERVAVGAPQQAADVDATLRGASEHLPHLGARSPEPLIGVGPPAGEQQQVTRAERRHDLVEPGEVRGALDQRLDQVPSSPGAAVEVPPVHVTGRIASLDGGEQPVSVRHAELPLVLGTAPATGAPPRTQRVA